MCPLCWATALASFAALISVSVVAVACTDKWALAAAAGLGPLTVAHHVWPLMVPWWCFAALIAAAILRVAYLVIALRENLVVYAAWRQARQIAYRRCPTKQLTPGVSSGDLPPSDR